jgi:aldehyde dehydrogenase (NAD+)
LYGYVTGADLDQARAIARRIRAGAVSINHALDITAPFGGYRHSGNGREWGEFGFRDFLEIKAILGYRTRDSDGDPG